MPNVRLVLPNVLNVPVLELQSLIVLAQVDNMPNLMAAAMFADTNVQLVFQVKLIVPLVQLPELINLLVVALKDSGIIIPMPNVNHVPSSV